ncbi:pyruvate formate-lyase-activating protein [Caproiciproducens sp. MSJ-32]|uniref:pyruvate formate-lyase-activating protein n=1 Tax=Caproiciproducens sp. MSJ-32 TaxID=2841527 RepID=UPI001C0F549E|nr:pyruvate formate-lyase-activating protein [Caproiciproducens sp. MSJ-32]MBU5456008.1 pyruvate formate lyase-activating protein [Caproiciproducens sp. MSJ-32]
MTKGRIHSIETMGLVDGPGIRTVIFFQGCLLRCSYCHNPDTWNINGGYEIDAKDLVKKVLRYKAFFEKSGGGVTCSGGDPLMQPDFLLEFFKLCKENNIHTTLDTSGVGLGNYPEILRYTDLVLLDIKHHEEAEYKKITGRSMDSYKYFVKEVVKANTPLWIRHVVVPGVTDHEEHIKNLAKYIKSTFNNVEKIELLPYHTMGEEKYNKLGIDYRLKGLKAMDKDRCQELEKILYDNSI